MFEAAKVNERVLLVHIALGQWTDAERKQEFIQLVRSTGIEPLQVITASPLKFNPRYLIGKGKLLDEILPCVRAEKVDLVIFDHDLSPAQERNLEKELCCRVLDRSGLILDIFARRAQSFEGKLQVELAQLEHLSTRLVRGWTHLERQKGGIGLRGPGETQLETDRRLLADRIKHINKRLQKVADQRQLSRRERLRRDVITIALVGYTNAGKSSLFNALVQEKTYAADQLFATLDPTIRRLHIKDLRPAIIVDTVGFIRDLPHELVAAFKGTLEETRQADLLLHVLASDHPEHDEQAKQVYQVLAELDAKAPVLEVYNKIDATGATPRLQYDDATGLPQAVWVSALKGEGLDLLRQAIAEIFQAHMFAGEIMLPPSAGALRAKLYAMAAVLDESLTEDGHYQLTISLPIVDYQRLRLASFSQAAYNGKSVN